MKKLPFRLQAFATHLLLSLMIAAISVLLVFWLWHPAPLAKAVGVTEIFLMMLAIDAVLGPLLTLAVAKPGKASLKFDLTVIIALQLAALFYGLHSIAINRPVFLAFDTLRVEVIQAGDVPNESIQNAAAPFNHLSWRGPVWVAVKPPADDAERNHRLFAELQEGISPAMQPDLYADIETQMPNMLTAAAHLSQLSQYNPPAHVEAVLARYPDADKWLPVKAYTQDMVLLLDSQTGQRLDIVDLRPW